MIWNPWKRIRELESSLEFQTRVSEVAQRKGRRNAELAYKAVEQRDQLKQEFYNFRKRSVEEIERLKSE